MNNEFWGREDELKTLQRLREKRVSSLVVIRGRRRIGKSRLVEEFAKEKRFISFTGIPPEKKTTAKKQREEFSIQFERQLGPCVKPDDWGNLFYFLSKQINENERTVIFFDEITWMGSKDPVFLGKLKIAWDLSFLPPLKNKLLKNICETIAIIPTKTATIVMYFIS